MNCKCCSCLRWHPNKGFYCTVPNCNPTTSIEDVREIMVMAGIKQNDNQSKGINNRSGVITKWTDS